MSTIQVNSVAGLSAALQVAHGGDTIALAPGTYSGLGIGYTNFSSAVTITSADPTHQAVISGLKIAYSSGINFTNLQLTTIGSTDPIYAFRIADSSNLSFSNIHAGGDASLKAYDQICGFYITGSSNVSITNSTLDHMSAGIIANNDYNVQISNDSFAYLNKGGIEMGGTSNVTIANNSFTNFQVQSSVHPDAIQLYTAGMISAANNVSITGNNIERGDGDAVQGIFVSDDTGGLMPFNNLTIANNTIVGGMWDSLYVASATGNVNISNNYVASWAGLDLEGGGTTADINSAPTVTGFAGYIWLQDIRATTFTETGNTAQAYLSNGGARLSTPAGNTLIGAVQPYAPSTPPVASVTAVAQHAAATTLGQTSGNLLTGDVGAGVYLASVATSSATSQLVSETGTTFAGKYGTLTVSSNGAFTYSASNFATTVGATYDDQFALTIGSSGQATSTTLDVILTATGVGDGKVDYITGGAAASTVSAFGAGSVLKSGIGSDAFVFNNIGQSTLANETTILGFKAGDVIDLSGLASNLKIVSQFDGRPGEVVLSHMGTGNWQVQVDTTGTGAPNFAVHLLNTAKDNLIAADFILTTSTSSSASATGSGPNPVNTNPVTTTPIITTPAAAANTAATTSTPASQGPIAIVGDGHMDNMTGGATASVLSGFGTGSRLLSGVGADKFVFGNIGQSTLANETTIGFFKAGDQIDLSALGANLKIVSQFDGHAGEVVLAHMGTGNWQVQVDMTGAGTPNFAVHLLNTTVSNLSAADFILTTPGATSVTNTVNSTAAVGAASTTAQGPIAIVGDGHMDNMTGGSTASVLSGFGTGSRLLSGVGADTFVFGNIGQSTLANETTIGFFKDGDIIDLSGISPNLKIVDHFDGHANELFLAHMGNGNWQVQVDTTGAGVPDFAVHLLNTTVASLSAANFHL